MNIADQLQTIADNVPKVYQAGYDDGVVAGGGGGGSGYDEGYADGQQNVLDIVNYELAGRDLETAETAGDVSSALDNAFIEVSDVAYGYGKQAEYDAFWDAYQQNGNRTDYQNCFSGEGWTEETFKPKYDIFTTNSYMLFRRTGIKDLGAAIHNCGKKVTTSHTNLQFTFQQSQYLESIDGIEFTVPLIYINGAFSNCNVLRKIQTLPIAENATTLDFTQIPALEDVSFSGVIPVNISFAQSRLLSNTSVQSIIDHLKDLTGATAKTLTFHATVGGNMTAEQKAAITAKNWTLVY